MNIRLCRRKLFAISLIAISLGKTQAALIDFDNLTDGQAVTTSYLAPYGIEFFNATALAAGVSLNELEFPPRSGLLVASDDGGAIEASFVNPVSFVEMYVTYSEPVVLRGFDMLGNPIALDTSNFSANYVGSGNAPNELFRLDFAGGIKSIQIGSGLGGSLTMDDLSFETASTSVPDAGVSGWIVAAMWAGICWARQKRT